MTDRPGVGRGTLVAGGLVLLAGVVWLLSAMGVDIRWEMVLAVALIGVGIALLALARSDGGTTPLIIAGVVITAVLAFTGGAVFGPATRVTEQADFAEPISRIRVDTPSGEVEVNAGGEIVRVERTLSYGDERPEVIEQVEDGVLTLSVRCQGGGFLIGGCGADYVITAPADVALEVDTGSGGIDVNGMTAGGGSTPAPVVSTSRVWAARSRPTPARGASTDPPWSSHRSLPTPDRAESTSSSPRRRIWSRCPPGRGASRSRCPKAPTP